MAKKSFNASPSCICPYFLHPGVPFVLNTIFSGAIIFWNGESALGPRTWFERPQKFWIMAGGESAKPCWKPCKSAAEGSTLKDGWPPDFVFVCYLVFGYSFRVFRISCSCWCSRRMELPGGGGVCRRPRGCRLSPMSSGSCPFFMSLLLRCWG